MTKAEKFVIFGYYLDAVVCVCGAPKLTRQWVCRECRARNHDTTAGHALNAACEAHVIAAREFVELCRRTAANG